MKWMSIKNLKEVKVPNLSGYSKKAGVKYNLIYMMLRPFFYNKKIINTMKQFISFFVCLLVCAKTFCESLPDLISPMNNFTKSYNSQNL